jgi:four helix bundle protein
MRRCSISISSNIAEGCRGSNKELKQFLNISLGSSFEFETQLEISKSVFDLSLEACSPILERINIFQKRINASRNSIS